MVQKQESAEQDSISYEVGLKIRDIEESQRLIKDRLLLVGQNLIEFQEKNIKDINELKKNISETKSDITRIKEIVQTFSEEIAKSARKEEVAILARQVKMFEPLKFARIEDIEKIVDEKLNKHQIANKSAELKEISEKKEDRHAFWRGKV